MIRWTFYYTDKKDLIKQFALTALGVLLFVPTLVGIVSCGALLLNEDGGDPTAFFLPLLGYLGCYAAQAIILMLCERPYWFGFFAPPPPRQHLGQVQPRQSPLARCLRPGGRRGCGLLHRPCSRQPKKAQRTSLPPSAEAAA